MDFSEATKELGEWIQPKEDEDPGKLVTNKAIKLYKSRGNWFYGLDINKQITFKIVDNVCIANWIDDYNCDYPSEYEAIIKNWSIIDFNPLSMEEMEMKLIQKTLNAYNI